MRKQNTLYLFFVIDNLTFVRHEAVCGCMWVCGCVAVCGCVGVADRLLGIAIFFCNMCGLRRVCQSGCVCVRASVNMPDRVYLCPSVCSEEKPTQLTNPPKEMSRFSALIFSSKNDIYCILVNKVFLSSSLLPPPPTYTSCMSTILPIGHFVPSPNW